MDRDINFTNSTVKFDENQLKIVMFNKSMSSHKSVKTTTTALNNLS